MKMEARTSVALLLLAVSAPAVAQNTQPPQPDAQPPQPPAQTPQPSPPPATPTPPPQQNTQPAPPPPGSTVPQSPPPPRYPPTQQTQSPPAPQYTPPPPPPPPRQYSQPQWAHSETSYSEGNGGFRYHPFRFHVDGGGTITQRSSEDYYKNGWNVGAGLTWYPTSHLPLGLRVDGTYNEFDARNLLLQQASQTYMTPVDSGTQKIWGGDVDLELDLHFSPYVRGYLLAGGGWYRQQTTFRQTNYTPGYGCDWWGCGPGYYRGTGIVARNNTDWHFARNAGLGLEFAMGPITSFFVEARYMRINPNDAKSDFLPIRAGLRF
jgi:opacity protein-like surface antigen